MRQTLLAAAGMALLLAFVYQPTLAIPGQLLTSGDGARFFFPAFLWQRAHLPALPVWTTALGGGYPLVAESQMAACYPGQWPFLLLPDPVSAYNLYQLAHLLLAFLAARWLLQTLGSAPLPAAVGALAYALGGRLTGLLDHPNQPVVSAWLPLLYACTVHGLIRPRCRAAGALVLGLMLLAGHSQVVLIALLGLIPVAFAYAPRATRCRTALTTLAAVGLPGFALAGVQLVPFAELFLQSVRAGGFSFASADFTNISLWNLLLLAAPFACGDNGACWLAGRYLSELQLYCGMLPLLAALVTLTDRTARHTPAVRFWWGFNFVFLLLAMGGRTPLGPLLHRLPLFSSLLIPARYALLCQLAYAVLAATGFSVLRDRPRAAVGAGLLLATLLAAVMLPAALAPATLARAMQPDTLLTAAELAVALPGLIAELRTAAAWLGVALAALWFAAGARRRGQPRFAAAIILLALACDLTAYARRMLLPSLSATFFTSPPVAARIYHLPEAPLSFAPNLLLARGVEDFGLYTNLGLRLHDRFRPLLERPLPAALALARIDALLTPVLPRWRDCPFSPATPLAIVTDTPYAETLPCPAGPVRLQLVAAASADRTADTLALLTITSAAGRQLAARTLHASVELGQIREASPADRPVPVYRNRGEADFYLRYYGIELPLPGSSDKVAVQLTATPGTTLIVAGLALAGDTIAATRHYPRLDALPAPLPPLIAPRVWQDVPAAAQPRALLAAGRPAGDVAFIAGDSSCRAQPVTITLQHNAAEHCAATVSCTEPIQLVRLVAWYSAWECRIDGRPVPIAVADVMFQGVRVPAGTHTVEFRYRRTSLLLGLALTLLAALYLTYAARRNRS